MKKTTITSHPQIETPDPRLVTPTEMAKQIMYDHTSYMGSINGHLIMNGESMDLMCYETIVGHIAHNSFTLDKLLRSKA